LLDYALMSAKSTARSTAKTFDAVLERTSDRLHWVIARVPLDVHKVWGKRGQLRIQGAINGFSFSSTLFPTRKGEHFLIVNKKMQAGAKTAPGLTARFRLAPDTVPRPTAAPPKELLLVLKQSRRLLKFYESLPSSWRNDIATRISQGKHEETRRRRAEQMAERLLETLEAERDLPPLLAVALRQNPRAGAAWAKMTPSQRRRHLISIFYYRNPESRARRIAKWMGEIAGTREKRSGESRQEDWDYE
jgi:uncharacterized protein YdeI (YjbR/CyaY-like superfamily)